MPLHSAGVCPLTLCAAVAAYAVRGTVNRVGLRLASDKVRGTVNRV